MSNITGNQGQTDPYEQPDSGSLEEKIKRVEKEKPNGEQDRIDAEEEKIARTEEPEV